MFYVYMFYIYMFYIYMFYIYMFYIIYILYLYVLAHICRIDHPENNAAVSDELSVKSPRKLIIFVICETMFWIKASVEYLI